MTLTRSEKLSTTGSEIDDIIRGVSGEFYAQEATHTLGEWIETPPSYESRSHEEYRQLPYTQRMLGWFAVNKELIEDSLRTTVPQINMDNSKADTFHIQIGDLAPVLATDEIETHRRNVHKLPVAADKIDTVAAAAISAMFLRIAYLEQLTKNNPDSISEKNHPIFVEYYKANIMAVVERALLLHGELEEVQSREKDITPPHAAEPPTNNQE